MQHKSFLEILIAGTTLMLIIGLACGWLMMRSRRRAVIREEARHARQMEEVREKIARRRSAQLRIGDELFTTMNMVCERVGRPIGRVVQRIRENGDGYYIQISHGASSDPIFVKMWINIHLDREGREVSFTNAGGNWNPDYEMSVTEARKFIEEILIYRIWPEVKPASTRV